jgi:hypothetical protein
MDFYITTEHEVVYRGTGTEAEIEATWTNLKDAYWTGLTLWVDGEPVGSN